MQHCSFTLPLVLGLVVFSLAQHDFYIQGGQQLENAFQFSRSRVGLEGGDGTLAESGALPKLALSQPPLTADLLENVAQLMEGDDR